MALLPYFQTAIKELALLETKWASILNPFLTRPQLQSIILENVSLINGATTINHKLGRKLTGWNLVRQRAQAEVWDSQNTNQTPEITLILNSTASVVVDIEVF